MNYREFPPGESLKHIIDTYWFWDNTSAYYKSSILPDCSMDIIFNFGSSFNSRSDSKTKINNSDIIVTGMMTSFMKFFMEKNSRLFGIRFKPLGLNYFLNLGFDNLTNSILHLNLLISNYYYLKFKNIFLLEEYEEIIEFFETVFRSLLDSSNNNIDHDVSLAVFRMSSSPDYSVSRIIENTGISKRYLEIKFKREIGLSMKEFMNIKRFMKAKREISCSDKSLTEIAVNNDYYDSSHMIKDFIKYTGLTPKKWK